MKKALTIAGSDSGGGAGIQQDLKVFSALKVHGTSAITAITAQNTRGVRVVEPVYPENIAAQIDSVMQDIRPNAVKTGMLFSSEVIALVKKKVRGYNLRNLVVDPVMVSTSGYRLLPEDAVEELRKLMAVAKLSTPNIYEAEILSGMKIKSHRDMEKAAEAIGGNCLVKGGHLDAVDVLFYEGDFHRFVSGTGRVDVRLHGAGCALSAAITAHLAGGLDPVSSVRMSKQFVDAAISRYFPIGGGSRILDTGGIKLGRTYEEKEKKKVVEELEEAITLFTSSPCAYHLIPQVGANIAFALKGARGLDGVAGITGRIVRDGKKVAAVGVIDFGGTSHMGRVVLTAMSYDKTRRAAMNIRFSDEALSVCRKLGYSMSGFDRGKQPVDTKTVEQGTAEAISSYGGVPDIVYDCGGPCKEAMIRILGAGAKEVAEKAIKIGEVLE